MIRYRYAEQLVPPAPFIKVAIHCTATGRQLEKAVRRLTPFAPAHRGIDVDGVLAQVEAAQERVAAGSLDLDPPRV